MDVVRLGLPYTTQYVPDTLIEGYSSMIWTERFQQPGEFELKTPLVAETQALLPEDTLISHLDTDYVMFVENHLIEEDEDGDEVLTVTGRSLDAFLEHRFVEGPYQKKRVMGRNYSPTAAAAVLLYNAIDNASGKDVTRRDTGWFTNDDGPVDYPWNTSDRIANIAITDSVSVDGASRQWWLTEGMLYPQLAAILIKGDIAIRTIRPHEGSSAQVVTVKATPYDDRGTVVRTWTTGITSLRFDLYDGVDRSHDQSANDKVVFSVLQGHLSMAQYLYSKKDFKTVVEIMSSQGGADVYRNGTEQAYTGLRRRTMAMDGGSPEIPPEPEKPDPLPRNPTNQEKEDYEDAMDVWRTKHATWKNRRDNIIAEFLADNAEDALSQLKAARRVSLFSGDISSMAPYQFKTHYNLGDTVTLRGKYGEIEKMVVTEHTRTEDAEGDRGFPGLALP